MIDNIEGKELIERTEVEETPFVVITTEEGSFVGLGKYRVSEIFKNKEEALKDANNITWTKIIQLIIAIKENKEL